MMLNTRILLNFDTKNCYCTTTQISTVFPRCYDPHAVSLQTNYRCVKLVLKQTQNCVAYSDISIQCNM